MEHVSAGQGRISTEWMARSACRDVNPELFFPVAQSGPLLRIAETAALSVCVGCPVLAACQRWALATHQEDGVVGGMTESERRAVWERQAAARATEHTGQIEQVEGGAAA